MTKDELIAEGKLLTAAEVRQMWGVSAVWLSRKTNHPDENERIPCYRFGKPKYAFNELEWWKEKHRYTPKKRRGKNNVASTH